MKSEQDILKSLLLKEELELLEKISQKILSEEQFTEQVSDVLGNAVIRAQQKSGHLQRALSTPIKAGVKNAFSDNKQSIIDALLPIMGKLIRKTVTNSIKQFVSDINRALELGVSAKSLKWRWQAKKAGITFAEMVFQKTVRYQVEEIFLINRENGLLIEYIGSDDMLKDNNAISAMLTAIQDFIGDSLRSSETDTLASAEIANKQFIITSGPTAFLASVVKGSPTEKFKERSQKLIENIHADFSAQLHQENNYRNIAGLADYLKPHLVTKNIGSSEKKTNWWPWIIGLLLIMTGLTYWAFQRNKELNHITQLAQSIEGLSVNNIDRHQSGFLIEGLVDPMADLSLLDGQSITLKTKPFISLDPGIISKRVAMVISQYDGVSDTVDENTVTLSGLVSDTQHQSLLTQINNVIGINHVNDQLNIDNSATIKAAIHKNFNDLDELAIKVEHNQVYLSGKGYFERIKKLKSLLANQFLQISIDDSQLTVLDTTASLLKNIDNTEINVPDFDQSALTNNKDFALIIKSLQSLQDRDFTMVVNIVGSSDCNGQLSNAFSQQRADFVKQVLIENAIKAPMLLTSIRKCERFDQNQRNELLKVTFNIQQ